MIRCLLSCLILLAASSSLLSQDRLPRHVRYPKWISDYEAARQLARAEGKPLLIVLRCEP